MDNAETSLRDHLEICASDRLAGVSDKGIIHNDNQDAFGLSSIEIMLSPVDVPPIYIAVVCDGVSSSASGASASAVAAETALAALKRTFLRFPDADARKSLREAISAANRAVYAIVRDSDQDKDPPATTVAAVVVQERKATVAWIGDTRVYWIAPGGEGVLTRDDSWVNAMIDAGRMTEEEALQSPLRSALIRSLGGEREPETEAADPSFATFDLLPAVRLVICSDGFWNYAPTPQNVARLVRNTPAGDPLGTAKHLVNFANAQGGHDNITVVVLAG